MIKKLTYSILAGVAISIGCIIYLLCSNKIVGAILFSVGILMVMEFKFLLFTGYVPKERENQPVKEYLINSAFVFIGNLLGAMLTALVISLTRLQDSIYTAAKAICEVKLSDNLLSIFILSILCGIIIAAIVKAENYKMQVLYVAMMIAVFILSGYEHVVANAFYLSITLSIFTWQGLLFMLVCLLGNFAGGFLFSFINSNTASKENNL